jgi:hypothetical protein
LNGVLHNDLTFGLTHCLVIDHGSRFRMTAMTSYLTTCLTTCLTIILIRALKVLCYHIGPPIGCVCAAVPSSISTLFPLLICQVFSLLFHCPCNAKTSTKPPAQQVASCRMWLLPEEGVHYSAGSSLEPLGSTSGEGRPLDQTPGPWAGKCGVRCLDLKTAPPSISNGTSLPPQLHMPLFSDPPTLRLPSASLIQSESIPALWQPRAVRRLLASRRAEPDSD